MKQNKVGYRKNNSLDKTTVQEKQHSSQNTETKKKIKQQIAICTQEIEINRCWKKNKN